MRGDNIDTSEAAFDLGNSQGAVYLKSRWIATDNSQTILNRKPEDPRGFTLDPQMFAEPCGTVMIINMYGTEINPEHVRAFMKFCKDNFDWEHRAQHDDPLWVQAWTANERCWKRPCKRFPFNRAGFEQF